MNDFSNNRLCARDYRIEADRICNTQKDKLTKIYLIYFLITIACSFLSFIGIGAFASILTTGGFTLSFAFISKKLYYNELLNDNDLYFGFQDFAKGFILYLLQSLFISLWSLLFIIPGIIKSFAYSMAYFIQIDNPNLKATECLDRSQKMMMGHKWDYFCLIFSYLGWVLLSCLTFGILLIWVLPKMNQASYLFYQSIKGISEEEVYEYNVVETDSLED